MLQNVSLSDRYNLEKSRILVNGSQALVRLMLMQSARDRAAGVHTAGYVTGYRGSPLGAVDMQMTRAAAQLQARDVIFHPALNEDLAATALWGTQQAELRGDGQFQGVFGLWYGKGPGVDRSGDVMRHVNFAGTSAFGGVLMAMGDDHTGESSTTLHQSDLAMIDAHMPILSPAGVQEILDFGLYGFELSRFSGLWVGLKLMKDTAEVTSVVEAAVPKDPVVIPKINLPEGGLNIRLRDTPQDQEARLMDHKIPAVLAFARANPLDARVWGQRGARIGFVAAGKNWLDLEHALTILGFDGDRAIRSGITTYKVAMTWPLETEGFCDWAEGLDLIVVVEEKRKLLEPQIKDALFEGRKQRVWGAKDGAGELLFTDKSALDPVVIAQKIGPILLAEGVALDDIKVALERIENNYIFDFTPTLTSRKPYFCAGCPHNSSTKIPEGSRAYAGIGCHYLAQWMDRETLGFTQMGGEGANWIGEARFSKTGHVFQNIGDGTYNHSGLMAIRAAVAAQVNMTYKVLYNDAVAMTGGQSNDGALSPQKIAAELCAAGVDPVVLVYDEKEPFDPKTMPPGVRVEVRERLIQVQEELRKIKGVSGILYVQTCAAEKRRRRKKGLFPDPDQRVMINPDVCEGCGDCGVQSNCVSIVPLETPLGRKRAIDQSSCNKDFSCVNGFCPSFVTVTGGVPRTPTTEHAAIPDLPLASIPRIEGTWNIVITGVGGTGVVTIGAVLAMAAHLEGKGAGMMEMAGLAQKGGAVHIHVRLANSPSDIRAIRVASGECDTLIGGDLLVSAGAGTLKLIEKDKSVGVINSHNLPTGDFTRERNFDIGAEGLERALRARFGSHLKVFDATASARRLLGDTIYSNMLILGAAWQLGWIPLSRAAILEAIELNATAVAKNTSAFEFGRWAAADFEAFSRAAGPDLGVAANVHPPDFEGLLTQYQSQSLADKFRRITGQITDEKLKNIVSLQYFRLLTYKDEYEVARLLLRSEGQAQTEFAGRLRLTYHLAPPIFSRTAPNGRPIKRAFGPWLRPFLKALARGKFLRGTWADPFGYTEERRTERALIHQYEEDLKTYLPLVSDATRADISALFSLPQEIRGFGPVKKQAIDLAVQNRQILIKRIQNIHLRSKIAAE